jgi:hypothetical protein
VSRQNVSLSVTHIVSSSYPLNKQSRFEDFGEVSAKFVALEIYYR